LCLGGPALITLFQLPQEFQLVHDLSGLDAGVRLIPFTIAMAIGSSIAALVAGKLKVRALYIVIAGACVQVVGFALLSQRRFSMEVSRETYGFQVLAGLGVGANFTMFYLLVPFTIEPRDQGKLICLVLTP
jgi:putative effector of murein hydrolase